MTSEASAEALPPASRETVTAGPRPVEVVTFDEPVAYEAAWALQRRELEAVAGGGPDRLLLLQHPQVYTAGRRTEPHERPVDGTPVIDVDRGGKITWHGPGQLVGYPIVALPQPLDVVAYVRTLEGALIAACADLGVTTERVDGRSGAWVVSPGSADRKVAAIGIRVERGVTMHGFSLNCDCDLSWSAPIVPCGIADAEVTSLSRELGRIVDVAQARTPVRERMLAAIAGLRAARPGAEAAA